MAAGDNLSQLTGYLLRRAYVCAVAALRDPCTDRSALREMSVLSLLAERGPLSQREISDHTWVSPTQMVKIVDGLESHGWVVRERNEADRRSYALRLTTTGHDAMRELQLRLRQGEEILTAALDEAESRWLCRQLVTLLQGHEWLCLESLVESPGFLIAEAHRQFREHATKALAPSGVSPRDFGVLSVLGSDQPCSQNHVAERLGVSPPAVLAMVEELAGRGLVVRRRNVEDRRVYDVRLTTAGEERLRAAVTIGAELQARVVAQLGVRADRELRRLLSRIVTAQAPGSPPQPPPGCGPVP